MSIKGENVMIPPPPKGDAFGGGKTTPIDRASKDSYGATLLRDQATQAPKKDYQAQEEAQGF
jgi:hypothetical protein